MLLNQQSTARMAQSLNKTLLSPVLGMVYGSQKEEKDIDLFFIFKGVSVQKNIVFNQFDLNQIEFNDFQFRLENFDIEYTEPILTGEYSFGNMEILKKAKEFLKTHKPNKENLDYLGKRALETYLQAKMLYTQGKKELFDVNVNKKDLNSLISKLLRETNFDFYCPKVFKSLSLLTYSLSYLATRKRYSKGENQVIFGKILEKPITKYDKELVSLIEYFKSRKETLEINMSKTNQYFENTKNLLIEEASD